MPVAFGRDGQRVVVPVMFFEALGLDAHSAMVNGGDKLIRVWWFVEGLTRIESEYGVVSWLPYSNGSCRWIARRSGQLEKKVFDQAYPAMVWCGSNSEEDTAKSEPINVAALAEADKLLRSF